MEEEKKEIEAKAEKQQKGFKSHEFIAKTFYGLEGVLAKELLQLGARDIEELNRAVKFSGDLGFLYKANLCLRTALRILMPLRTFKVRNEQQLYDNIQKINWSEYLGIDKTFVINATANSDNFTHSHYVSLKVKDAIVDQFRERYGKRPSIDKERPDIRIQVHISDLDCTVSLDSSGESLHKRGYRIETNNAPINEVLAAGLVLLSDWDQNSDFIDPMCGSGTIVSEAAMIARGIPANIHRKEFAFQRWMEYDEELFDVIVDSSLNKERGFDGRILGSDKAFSAFKKSERNIEHALLEDFIKLEKKDFFGSSKPEDSKRGVLIFNPPYGERQEKDLEEFYKNIGDTLKHGYPGYSAWVITSSMEALKFVGLRTSRKIKLFNGPLECRYVNYQLYDGSKKASKNTDA